MRWQGPLGCFLPPARSWQTDDCPILPERRAGFRRKRTHARFFFRVLKVGWDRSVELRVVALRGNRGPGCANCSPSQIDVVLYPGSDRVSEYLYCTGITSRRVGIAPPPFPCTAQVLFLSRRVGIAPSPLSLYCTGVILVEKRGHSPPPHFLFGARAVIGTVCFLCMWSVIPRNLSLFYVLWWWCLSGCL